MIGQIGNGRERKRGGRKEGWMEALMFERFGSFVVLCVGRNTEINKQIEWQRLNKQVNAPLLLQILHDKP